MAAEQAAWLADEEKGSRTGLRFVLGVVRAAGRGAGRIIVAVVAFYYALFAGRARRASTQYLRRVGVRAGFWGAYRHIRTFAEVTLDRLFLLGGQLDKFEFERCGTEYLLEQGRKGQGALLLGAHLGSYEAMRAVSLDNDVVINVLAHFENAAKITAFLEEASGGDPMMRVVPVDPRDPTYILKIKELIEQGQLVAMLGDRLGVNEKSAFVDFMGAPAGFPVGPYVIAYTLGCPVYLVFGLYSAPNRYSLHCEPFADKVELPRKGRKEAIESYTQAFATRLEHFCRLAPTNWFNFYDFWSPRA